MEIGSAGRGRQGRKETSTKHHCLGSAGYLAFTTVQADGFTVNSHKTNCQKVFILYLLQNSYLNGAGGQCNCTMAIGQWKTCTGGVSLLPLMNSSPHPLSPPVMCIFHFSDFLWNRDNTHGTEQKGLRMEQWHQAEWKVPFCCVLKLFDAVRSPVLLLRIHVQSSTFHVFNCFERLRCGNVRTGLLSVITKI